MAFNFISSDSQRELTFTLDQVIASSNETGFDIQYIDGKLHDQLTEFAAICLLKFTPNGYTRFSYLTNKNSISNITICEAGNEPHYNDYIQVAYILTGKLYIGMNGREECFSENEFLLLDTSCYHRYLLDKSDGVILYIGIAPSLFTETFLGNIKKDTLQYFIRSNILGVKSEQQYIRYRPSNRPDEQKLSSFFSDIYFELKSGQIGNEYMIKGYLIRLFDFIANNYHYSFAAEQRENYRRLLFKEIETYIDNHYSNCTMQDLIDTFHYQTGFLNKLIKEFSGMTYSHFLITARIKKAKQLLMNTSYNIDDIIYMTGYNNKGFFYKAFAKETGMTPSAYRDKYRSLCD